MIADLGLLLKCKQVAGLGRLALEAWHVIYMGDYRNYGGSSRDGRAGDEKSTIDAFLPRIARRRGGGQWAVPRCMSQIMARTGPLAMFAIRRQIHIVVGFSVPALFARHIFLGRR